ncbi:hypothetical protein D3C83_42320 [compost metagenome]
MNLIQSGSVIGAARPFSQRSPGSISSAEASASAVVALSTAGHPVYAMSPQSNIVSPSGLVGGGCGGRSLASTSWIEKIRFELWKNTLRII